MKSDIESKILNDVEVQSNGIIRNFKGHIIGRLTDDTMYNSEHIKFINENKEFSENESGEISYYRDMYGCISRLRAYYKKYYGGGFSNGEEEGGDPMSIMKDYTKYIKEEFIYLLKEYIMSLK